MEKLDHSGIELSRDRAIFSFTVFSKVVGTLALALPLLLITFESFVLGAFTVQKSLSYYYHTVSGNILICVFFMLGVYMFSFRRAHNIEGMSGFIAGRVSDVIGVCMIGIALIPARMHAEDCPLPRTNLKGIDDAGVLTCPSPIENMMHDMHFYFSVTLFVSIAYLCFFIFPKIVEQNTSSMFARRLSRYCGIFMVLAMFGLLGITIDESLKETYAAVRPTFLFESIVVMTFGLSLVVISMLESRSEEQKENVSPSQSVIG